jgi:4-amino-4-deoxy-L-arabinose transferase-like glycosyltransferase
VRRHWAIAAIVIVAAVARLWGIHFGLPYLNARPDEGTIVSIAGGMYHGDLNPHFFNYPALFMTSVAAVLLLFPDLSGTTTPYMIARSLSAGAGIASVLVLFRIGQRLFGQAAGLASAALLAVAFLHVRDSHFGVTDVPMTFLVLVALWFMIRVSESARTRDVVAAGVASGLATSTKYNAALLALPALFAIFMNRREDDDPLRDRASRTALFGCTMAGAFLLTSPFSLFEFREFIADVTFESRHLAAGHKVVLGRGWIYHVTSSLRYGIGFPFLVTGILGLLLLIVRDRRNGALVAAFPLSYYLLVGSGYTVFVRYIIPVVPFLCLTAGYAVTEGAAWVSARTGRAFWKPAVAALSVVCLAWPSAQSVVSFNRLISRTDSRVVARQWLERHVPPGRTIAQLGTDGGQVLLFQSDSSEVVYVRANLARPGVRPDVVIVHSSPLSSRNALGDREVRILSRDYEPVMAVNAVASDERANIYDWQDDFFLPLTGFKRIERPGPNVMIYMRRGELPSVPRLPG